MEIIASKSEDRIAMYKEVIKVDDMIKKYFNNYERINGFKYSKVHSFMVINSSEFNNLNGMSDICSLTRSNQTVLDPLSD